MISLQPREQFTIVRQLGDHTDPTTYFVQAVVRNSIDDKLLKTLNLTAKGNDRFKGLYEVPADISGLGFYIDITTSVYTDNTYTTKASTYSDENETYLVFDRIMGLGTGGGGGPDVDYKKIQAMFDKLAAALPTFKETDLQPILNVLAQVRTDISNIVIPEHEKMNYDPILQQIDHIENTIVAAIAQKEVTEKTDLQPIMDAIEQKEPDLSAVTTAVGKVQKSVDTLSKSIADENDNRENLASTKLQHLSESVLPMLSTPTAPVKTPKQPIRKSAQDRAMRLLNPIP